MVSQKREELLSEKEKERLKARDSLDSRTRAANDIRVKRKLAAWINGVDDVLLILEHLPNDTIRKVANDDLAVMRLATTSVEMMRLMGYRPIVGDVGRPESWLAISKRQNVLDVDKIPANDVDITRSANLTLFSHMLETMLGSENNPVSAAIGYDISKDNPALVGFLKEHPDIMASYQKALDRIREAGSTFAERSSK
jgi:hypothetical protein